MPVLMILHNPWASIRSLLAYAGVYIDGITKRRTYPALHHEGIVLSNTAFKARETCSSIVLEGLWRAIKRFMTPLRSADWSFECVDCTKRVLLVCRDVQSASRCSLLESTIYKIHPSGSATFKRVTPHRKCWSSHSVGSREFWWICWSCSCDCWVLVFVGLFIWHHAVFIIIET